MKEIIEVLDLIGDKKLSVDEGIKVIEELRSTQEIVKKSRWIKIKIKDGESGKRINLPPIPLGLAGSLASWGIMMGINHSDEKEILHKLDRKDIKKMFDVFKESPPMVIVEIFDESEGTEVEVYTK
ncbi:MAG TPA: hypothetical protein DCG34_00175 [Clostridiales bacterium]|jgi:hypothetical protein|nr:hypothetical protein [Clostridiales bacterium]